jgi:hypothetical protein
LQFSSLLDVNCRAGHGHSGPRRLAGIDCETCGAHLLRMIAMADTGVGGGRPDPGSG